MSKDIEKLIKLQGIINKNKFHLCIHTDLETKAEWRLYQIFEDFDTYISTDNHAILESGTDTIDDLIQYIKKHNGLTRRW